MNSGGAEGNGASSSADISASGRFVAFTSIASNLVPSDTNDAIDVFVRDLGTGLTRRISLGLRRKQANGDSAQPAISATGRYVAFTSAASNLVPGDTNDAADVFVRDRATGLTRRISIGPDGVQADGDSSSPAISARGGQVGFASFASNLVPGDTNLARDVFVRDRAAQATLRVSVGPGGEQGNADSANPSISQRGRQVAFESSASNLVPGDTNLARDVFVHDRSAHMTRLISRGLGGVQADGDSFDAAISARGRHVAFTSIATNLVAEGDTNNAPDVLVRDRAAQRTLRVSVGPGGVQANHDSVNPAISAGGRYVAFQSFATNLVAEDIVNFGDVFVRDRGAQQTTRVSVGPGGERSNHESREPAVSRDGRYVAFQSFASNLVAGDTNTAPDVFVHDLSVP